MMYIANYYNFLTKKLRILDNALFDPIIRTLGGGGAFSVQLG
jgi:hypothetical protein